MFETLVNVGRTINSTLSLDDALQTITREAALLMDAKTWTMRASGSTCARATAPVTLI